MLHTNRIPTSCIIAAAACLLVGCPSENKSPTASSAKADTSSAATADSSAELSDEELDKEDIPTQEDFEEKAREEITEDNYLDELEKLENEIEGDTGATKEASE